MPETAHRGKETGIKRVRLSIKGRVQGVGFRPHLFRKMQELSCGGHITNTPEGVCIEIEGRHEVVEKILSDFSLIIPPRARIDEIAMVKTPPLGENSFAIKKSRSEGKSMLPIPPDMATCTDCKSEMVSGSDRRYGYAFNTCTCCGPRFSIARNIPFDRETSTMAEFPLCEQCNSEFTSFFDRRFHAQTMSCPACGPKFFLKNRQFTSGGASRQTEFNRHSFDLIAEKLNSGAVIAIKGTGGFHLACDASDEDAVRRIRKLKGRPHKPLGVMAADIETVSQICRTDKVSRELMLSEEAPMVILFKKNTGLVSVPVAPGLNKLGVMLPYTPLHILLFCHPGTPRVIVMTSCNRNNEPIAADSEAVDENFGERIDIVLDHNRHIENRCDDSLAAAIADLPVVYRRSRGYVPEPVIFRDKGPACLAVGAMWKNTFTLTNGNRAYISQHIGNVSDADNTDYFRDTVKKFSDLLRIEPEMIACDMHPDYPTTAFARELASERRLPLLEVQHHQAHILSCLAEHRIAEAVIGVSMDGTGYGDDGRMWGGEFLISGLFGYRRRFHFSYIPMPGGEKAATEPFRMALSYLVRVFGPDKALGIMEDIAGDFPLADICSISDNRDFSPLTSSCGRLFDAVASLLGIRQRCTYEGQAACELEAIADSAEGEEGIYPYALAGDEIVFSETVAEIYEELMRGSAPGTIAARFHNTIAKLIVDICALIREEEGLNKVALTGGVMQNRYLTEQCIRKLKDLGFVVLAHRNIPPNDGGISLGQALYANHISHRDVNS